MRTVEIEYLFSAALIRVISYLVSFVIYPFLIFIHLLSFSVLPNFRKRMKSEIAMHFLVSLLSLHCVLVKRRCQRSTLLHNFPLPHEAT